MTPPAAILWEYCKIPDVDFVFKTVSIQKVGYIS